MKYEYRWLGVIVVVAIILRLFNLTTPVADWHSFRQADTASVTREYVKQGIDLLHPKYQDLSNIQSGLDNLEGYRMVEFPLINAVIAFGVTYVGLPLVATSRVVSIAFSVLTLLSLYFLVKELSGRKTAFLTAIVFAILPYSIFYSRVIMPEPAFLGVYTLSLLGFYYWLKNKSWDWYLISLVSLMGAFLLKPFVGFLIPIWLVLAYQALGLKKMLLNPWLYIYALASVLPFVGWRQWIQQYPSGIPANSWLFNSNGIRLRPAWFRWLFWERLTILFLGYVGIIAFPFNLLKRGKDFWVYAAWWVGILAYFVVIATGNVQHDYYQNMALPIVCISLARGLVIIAELLHKKVRLSVNVSWILCGILLAIAVILAWKSRIQGYYQINHWEYVEAGAAVDRLTPPDAKVIAPAFGDTVFLFQTNRQGWPIGYHIDEKINNGAEYYVTTSMDDEANELKAKYQTVEQTPLYLILNLTQPLETSP